MVGTHAPSRLRRPSVILSLHLPATLTADYAHSVPLRWIALRTLTLVLLVRGELAVVRDTTYYASQLHSMFLEHAGLHAILIEYPLPVLLVMVPQFLLGRMNPVAFALLFAATMLFCDACFTYVLWRADGRRRGYATNFWLWFVPCVGPMAYFRFDLVPAVLTGAAVLMVARNPATSGALTAFGAAVKLWPAIMLPILLLRRDIRTRVLAGFLVAAGAILLGTITIGGLSRTLSPVRYQAERGLQIESVAASPLMLARSFAPRRWPLRVSRFRSWEIYGPWVHGSLVATTVLTGLGLVVLAGLWWRALRSDVVTLPLLGWMFLATALVVTVTNKALSPQYILWLGGPFAGLASQSTDRQIRRAGSILLVIAVLTHVIFPIAYSSLTVHSWKSGYAASLLVARNALLLYLTCLACHRVWQLLARRADSAAPSRPLPVQSLPSRA
jgi:Glycosyltransferase family 87